MTAPVTHRILVAEDNEAMLRLITRHLQAERHEVLQAHDGRELMHWIDQAARHSGRSPLFDLIVADHRMPGPSGLQCLVCLRTRGAATPVILITAFGDPHLHAAALAFGARAVLDKPLDLRQLSTAVWGIL